MSGTLEFAALCAALGALLAVPLGAWIRSVPNDPPLLAPMPWLVAASAAVFGVMGLRFGWDPVLPAYLYFAAIMVVLTAIDVQSHRLPNVIVLPSYGVAVALLFAAALAGSDWDRFWRALLGGAALFAFYFALAWINPAGMGFGDVKLAGVLGLFLGWLGWGALIIGAFLGFLLGAFVGGGLMVLRRAERKTRIPFGPFMFLGALIAILWGQSLANWYGGVLAG